ncbi:MAG: UbiA family prenyltransferase, partial [Pseudomonadota bacterium]
EAISHARAEGRPVLLASGAEAGLVARLGARVGVAETMGSGAENLTGAAKARALAARFGAGGFDYLGNAATDIPVWQAAGAVQVVAPSSGLAGRLARLDLPTTAIGEGWRARDLARALRPHQWIKNALLLLPLISAQVADVAEVGRVLAGVLAFCLAASAVYVVNDLLDLDADRRHPTKRLRGLASGRVPIRVGMAAGMAAAAAALVVALALGWAFTGVLAGYVAISLAYSLWLKRGRWVDLATLGWLYTHRTLAGSVAAGLPLTPWLVSFVLPGFVALAAVKRLTELARAAPGARLPGRGYGGEDRRALLLVAAGAGLVSVAVLAGYATSTDAAALYPAPGWIAAAALCLAIWFGRMIRLGWAGRQDYDPVVFALRDPPGLALMAIAAGAIAIAAGAV